MDTSNEEVMYEYADKFINLANEMAQSDKSGTVGMAIRFAAARFSVFETTTQTDNLAADKDKYLEIIADNFNKVLHMNFEEYIQVLSRQ